ncbi:hypothetical protein AB7044_08325 [Providencia stuartii]|uniref:hypothetical protein n=1 Tax=Providencia stuartii TaxID=588 RepID=UPI0034E5417B
MENNFHIIVVWRGTASLRNVLTDFSQLIHHKNVYLLNAKRNTTFMTFEDKLQKFAQDDLLKQSLERFKEDTYEISVS